jgi:hypothetical protein
VASENLQDFFDNYLEASDGAPGEHVHYDEINFKDCVSTNKVLAKMGMKYVEVLQNTSHSATS